MAETGRLRLPDAVRLRPRPGPVATLRLLIVLAGLLSWEALAASGLATCDRLSQTVIWLRDLLANGRVPSREIHEQAAKQAIPRVLLYKAKAQAGARAVKDGVNRRWCWELIPDDQPPSTAPASPPANPASPAND